MVESAPLFIEYYCEGYMHIDAVTALCICSFVSAVFACFLSSLFHFWLDKKYFGEHSNNDHRESHGALSPCDCEDATCNDCGKENL